MIKKTTIILTIIILVLLAGNVYFYLQYSSVREQLDDVSRNNQVNTKIVAFSKLFVEKVLVDENEVSYEDRLKLENAVVDTQDEDIINEWHNFLNSKTEFEAQAGTKKLLSLFVNKIIY